MLTEARPRIFLVEDTWNMQSALRSLLEDEQGFEIVGTAVGEFTAMQWLMEAGREFDIASIDLMLHDGSGFPIIRRCREYNPQAHIVVFSEFVTDAVRTHCIGLGANAVFRKLDVQAYAQHLDALRPAAAG